MYKKCRPKGSQGVGKQCVVRCGQSSPTLFPTLFLLFPLHSWYTLGTLFPTLLVHFWYTLPYTFPTLFPTLLSHFPYTFWYTCGTLSPTLLVHFPTLFGRPLVHSGYPFVHLIATLLPHCLTTHLTVLEDTIMAVCVCGGGFEGRVAQQFGGPAVQRGWKQK